MKLIDNFLNGITMYRLLLYILIFLPTIATILSFFKLLPFNPFNLVITSIFLVSVCWITNRIFSMVFEVPANVESFFITALILALIITPVSNLYDLRSLFWVAVISMASKYILALNKKHIFNPAAFAVFLTSITLNYSASWWIGTAWMMPFVLICGFLIVRKIRRSDLVFTFLVTSFVLIVGSGALKGQDILTVAQKLVLDTPFLFFAFVMLTEPLTTPPIKKWQIIYGGLVGILFAPFVHIGSFYFTPETALLAGNIFSYFVSPKGKLLLSLKEKIQIAPQIFDFVFAPRGNFTFLPGQYMEWTLSYKNPDSRGTRRYFTIASSPTEDNLRIGVKFYPNSSSYKKNMLIMNSTQSIVAAQLSGEFTLPKDAGKKLCFIAGGIGITPYRSMIKYLQDRSEKRDIILFYSSKTEQEFVYKDILSYVKTVYVATEKGQAIDETMIKKEIPDFKERIFYISGPHSMIDAFEKLLKNMGVSQIKTDFFPGYA